MKRSESFFRIAFRVGGRNSPEETSVQTQDRRWLLGLWGLARVVCVHRAGLREDQAGALRKVSFASGNPLLCS